MLWSNLAAYSQAVSRRTHLFGSMKIHKMQFSQNSVDRIPSLLVRYHHAFMIIARSVMYRYGVALLFVGSALGFSLIFHHAVRDSFLIFFLTAVMLAGWFGRTGAGVLAVIVSMIAVDYYFIPPYRAFGVEVDELP